MEQNFDLELDDPLYNYDGENVQSGRHANEPSVSRRKSHKFKNSHETLAANNDNIQSQQQQFQFHRRPSTSMMLNYNSNRSEERRLIENSSQDEFWRLAEQDVGGDDTLHGGQQYRHGNNGDGNTYLVKSSEAAYIRNRYKRWAYLVMEDPSSSYLAFTWNILLALLILLNALVMIIETMPSMNNEDTIPGRFFLYAEIVVLGIFAVEFAVRLYGHTYNLEKFLSFCRSPLFIIDILAFCPFFIELIVSGKPYMETQRFSILRLFRLFRMFRVYKYQSLLQLSIEVLLIAVAKSAESLIALMLFIVTICTCLGTLIYFAERGTYSQEQKKFYTSLEPFIESNFMSIPSSMWFIVETLTTTGYGEVVPLTAWGKVVAFISMSFGILSIALPSIIVGRNYIAVWSVMSKYKTPDGLWIQRDDDDEDVVDDNNAVNGKAGIAMKKINTKSSHNSLVSDIESAHGADANNDTPRLSRRPSQILQKSALSSKSNTTDERLANIEKLLQKLLQQQQLQQQEPVQQD
ncbi:hypothetical protein MIR68_010047 [Amoeboaphelidium protococcarum]|nr:hypothetical protein MIR68_010047 [Amoeboaphelidium protococcarum]